jgi:hypothetical protein
MKSRRIRWVEHVADMGCIIRNSYRALVGDLGVDGMITLKCTLKNKMGDCGLRCMWLRIGSSGGFL